MTTLSLPNGSPDISAATYLAPGARLIGAVTLGEGSSVWFNAVLRADSDSITLGARSNLQDLVACHVDSGAPLTIGSGVSVGHSAVLHGCTIEDDCLIGMHSTVLSGAVVGRESLVAAGALVLEGQVIPPRSLVAGVPAKVRRELTDAEVAKLHANAEHYSELAAQYAGLS